MMCQLQCSFTWDNEHARAVPDLNPDSVRHPGFVKLVGVLHAGGEPMLKGTPFPPGASWLIRQHIDMRLPVGCEIE